MATDHYSYAALSASLDPPSADYYTCRNCGALNPYRRGSGNPAAISRMDRLCSKEPSPPIYNAPPAPAIHVGEVRPSSPYKGLGSGLTIQRSSLEHARGSGSSSRTHDSRVDPAAVIRPIPNLARQDHSGHSGHSAKPESSHHGVKHDHAARGAHHDHATIPARHAAEYHAHAPKPAPRKSTDKQSKFRPPRDKRSLDALTRTFQHHPHANMAPSLQEFKQRKDKQKVGGGRWGCFG